MTATDDAYVALKGFLNHDPDNVSLVADTARAAIDAGDLDEARRLIDRRRALGGGDAATGALDGLLAMARGEWQRAASAFAAAAAHADDPAIRSNLAWALVMAGRRDEALGQLDATVADRFPQAAQLLVSLLHDKGDVDAALAIARPAVQRFPDHRGLLATVSTLAVDAEDLDLARASAHRAGDHPQALTTLATLDLGDDRPAAAAALFARALTADPDNARAWIGRGLAALAMNDADNAVRDLDRGAELFGNHLGSWIAAGWAHLLAGEPERARERFDRALAIDDRFAEAHGSLAVIALHAGRIDDARRAAAIALRLDRDCFSGALATAMLAAAEDRPDRAQRLIEAALSTPVDAQGRTIGATLTRMALRR